ncbi:AGE family epimerase/isomerase [Asaia prunellae]|uniref:AGE family epimerase/isomerase n=1 Tax=Asaia prunellae TaxID=610245 RepID=UPI000AE2CA49|nr:AGE family epimerase/isomerase [Asaia prunellae]
MTRSIEDTTSETQIRWRDWLFGQALPLWSEAGFDRKRGLYHERLDWAARPIPLEALRLMVQARQISTFCRAALDGVHDAGTQALDCLDGVERRYHGVDGQPGWIFSIAATDRAAQTKRDLYAHAFILFAYGWAIRYANRPEDRAMARQIAEEIDQIFSASNGGYLDAIPDNGTMRSQNPHMHLLEAYLVVFEATGDSFFLDRATALVDLAKTRLIDPRSGLLLEFFAPDWRPLKDFGDNQVQPGHLFEWSWLLQEYARLGHCRNEDALWIADASTRLFNAGFSHGCDHARHMVLESMTDHCIPLERSARIWAQTELLRLLHTNGLLGNHSDASASFANDFLEQFAPPSLKGAGSITSMQKVTGWSSICLQARFIIFTARDVRSS